MTGFQRIERQLNDCRLRYTDVCNSFTVNEILKEKGKSSISANVFRKRDNINLYIDVTKYTKDDYYAVTIEYYNFTASQMYIDSNIYTMATASDVNDVIHASIVAFTL